MTRRRSAVLAVALSLGLVLSGCGDDTSPDATDDDSGETESSAFTVTLSPEGIQMPAAVTGGIVDVKLESELEGAEVNFSNVVTGTTEDQFKQDIVKVVTGGPIPDYIQATTGILGQGTSGNGESSLILPEGDYIAWSIPEIPEGEEGGGEGEEAPATTVAAGETARGQEGEGEGGPQGPPPEAVLTTTFTASAGEEGSLPDTGGNEIVARDYSFDVNVTAGGEEFTFRNEGPAQLHHIVLFKFGSIEPSVVEENLPAFLESGEGSPPPEAFKDVDLENLEAGDGPVLSAGLGATTPVNGSFESGTTYAAVCFISDRTGGPPHAFGNGMRTVFRVE